MTKLMQNPECYKMIKEKADGIHLGALKFPILFNNTIYLLPKDAGDTLVNEGYAVLCKLPQQEVTPPFGDEI